MGCIGGVLEGERILSWLPWGQKRYDSVGMARLRTAGAHRRDYAMAFPSISPRQALPNPGKMFARRPLEPDIREHVAIRLQGCTGRACPLRALLPDATTYCSLGLISQIRFRRGISRSLIEFLLPS